MKQRLYQYEVIYSDPERPIPLGKSADVRLLSCHLTPIQPGVEIREHEHSHWELSFMISGEMNTFCDGSTIFCREDNSTVLLIPPGTLHSRKFGPGNNCNLSIEFLLSNADFIRSAVRQCTESAFQFKLRDFPKAILNEIRRLSAESTEEPDGLLVPLSQTFLLCFLRSILHGNISERGNASATWRFQQDQTRANDIFRFLNTRVTSRHVMKKLSEFFGLSLRQLNRIFEKEYHQTISEARDEIRFRRAVLLLRNTDYTIREIAEETGFSGPAGFFLFFKRRTGTTPDIFRRKRKEA